MENSPARPRSNLMLSRSIQGEGSGTVSMVLQVDGAVPGAVTMVGAVSGGGGQPRRPDRAADPPEVRPVDRPAGKQHRLVEQGSREWVLAQV